MKLVTVFALAVSLVWFAVPTHAEPASAEHIGEWYTRTDDPCRSYYVGSTCKGVWCHVAEKWCEWSFDKWQHWKPREQCPVTPPLCGNPEALREAQAKLRLGGIVLPTPFGPPTLAARTLPTGNDAMRWPAQRGYWRNGKQVSKADVLAELTARIPDMSKLRRITVIGPEADRKAALRAIGKPDWATVREYDPDDWYVTWQGFVADGQPTVYVQTPDGTVIHRQDNLDGLEQALQRAHPDYDPKRDPDLRRPSKPDGGSPTPLLPSLEGIDWRSFAYGAAAAGVLIFVWSVVTKLQAKEGAK